MGEYGEGIDKGDVGEDGENEGKEPGASWITKKNQERIKRALESIQDKEFMIRSKQFVKREREFELTFQDDMVMWF